MKNSVFFVKDLLELKRRKPEGFSTLKVLASSPGNARIIAHNYWGKKFDVYVSTIWMETQLSSKDTESLEVCGIYYADSDELFHPGDLETVLDSEMSIVPWEEEDDDN